MDPVTICNMALGAFGQNPIESIEEDDIESDEAQLCATFYEPSVRACLEDAAPLFATDFIDLGARQDSAYALLNPAGSPSNVKNLLVAKFSLAKDPIILRPLSCDDGSGLFTIKWQRNGQFIICEDTDHLFCEHVFLEADPNKWTANFAWAVAYRLAYAIAGPITHSQATRREMLEEYQKWSKIADNLDGMAGTTNAQFLPGSTSLANRRR